LETTIDILVGYTKVISWPNSTKTACLQNTSNRSIETVKLYIYRVTMLNKKVPKFFLVFSFTSVDFSAENCESLFQIKINTTEALGLL